MWADVEVNMEDRVEVYSGEEARINCMFTSTEGVGALRIHWFYVSLIKPETQRELYCVFTWDVSCD